MRRHLGKQNLVTSRHDWDSVSIVRAYRRLTRTEELFRIPKSRPGVWWPLFHRAGCSVSVDRAVRRLNGVDETLVMYTNGATDRVLTELDETQMEIAGALGLLHLAEEMGTTVLEQD